jgi:CHRD domain-containing protein
MTGRHKMKRSILLAALALGGCAAGGPNNQRATLLVTLTGTQEAPGPGDPDGTGNAEIRVAPAQGQVCWTLNARGVDPATAAHIHRGPAGIAGPPVLTLTTPDAAGRSEGCAAVEPMLARQLSVMGHEFYVNVHTGPHPAGAIRGQLRGGPRREVRTRAGTSRP